MKAQMASRKVLLGLFTSVRHVLGWTSGSVGHFDLIEAVHF